MIMTRTKKTSALGDVVKFCAVFSDGGEGAGDDVGIVAKCKEWRARTGGARSIYSGGSNA